MIKFIFPEYNFLKDAFTNLEDGQFSINRFPNREMYIKIDSEIKDQECIITGTITPPDENLIKTLFLSHTLKKEGAEKIVLFLPYLAYTRHDKPKKGESLLTEEIGNLLRVSHIHSLITIESHSETIKNLYPLPIASLSTTKMFASEIRKLNISDFALIAPDEGAVNRIKELNNYLGNSAPIAFFKKNRFSPENITSEFQGQTSSNCIIVDDMLDTGKTLISACEILKNKNVQNIYIFVTHGIFTGEEWKKLWDLNVKKIYCTDTIPGSHLIPDITVLPVLPLVREYFACLNA